MQIKYQDHIRKDDCKMCSTVIGNKFAKRTEHRARCFARMRCAGCHVPMNKIDGCSNSIIGFCTHVTLCIGQGIFKCPKCERQDTKYELIDQHPTKCHKNVKCIRCNTEFLYPAQLAEHVSKKHPEIKCNICEMVFLTKKELEDHNTKHN